MSIDYDEWHSGPPPSVGWWPASNCMQIDIYRWWDGTRWSDWCSSCDTLEVVKFRARCPAGKWLSSEIYWRHRPPSWPKRSRT